MMRAAAKWIGSPAPLVVLAVTTISGTVWGYSDGWMKWYNFALSVAAIVAAVIVQASQNADIDGMQLKLDELIRAIDNADNKMRGIERQL